MGVSRLARRGDELLFRERIRDILPRWAEDNANTPHGSPEDARACRVRASSNVLPGLSHVEPHGTHDEVADHASVWKCNQPVRTDHAA